MRSRRAVAALLVLSACGAACTALNGVSNFTECSSDCGVERRDTTVVSDTGPGESAVVDTAVVDTAGDSGVTKNLVFITSTLHTGSFGGLAAADTICRARATEAGLQGTFRALLSTSITSAKSRLAGARGWVRVDGLPFADTVDDLFVTQRIYNPIGLNEKGARAAMLQYWTGSRETGLTDTDKTCKDWSSAMSPDSARLGTGAGGPSAWVTANFGAYRYTCDVPQSLACFGVDSATPLVVTGVASGKRIFSSSSVLPGGGRAAFDATCASEALAAKLTGTYKALVATTTEPPAARLNSVAVYVRPDGQRIGTGADIIAREIRTGLWQRASGTYITSSLVWVGSTMPADVGTSATTCSDWGSSSVTESGLVGNLRATTSFWSEGSIGCDSGRALYCAEQ